MPRLEGSAAAWRDGVRRIESLGFDTVSVSDHFTRGWVMEPTAAMLAAAEATERLRVLSLVLGNDYRHPVLLHKTMATIDLLSDGRLELGLGAGWMRSDYDAAGLPYDPPAVRLDRLRESLHLLKGLFGPDPLTFHGTHYRITSLDGLPKPVQRPHPPLLVGGGGKRVLGLAAREADIVSVHCNLRHGARAHRGRPRHVAALRELPDRGRARRDGAVLPPPRAHLRGVPAGPARGLRRGGGDLPP